MYEEKHGEREVELAVEDREPTRIEITHSPAVCRAVLSTMVEALGNGPKSRERSLAITKLQEAMMWLNEAMRAVRLMIFASFMGRSSLCKLKYSEDNANHCYVIVFNCLSGY